MSSLAALKAKLEKRKKRKSEDQGGETEDGLKTEALTDTLDFTSHVTWEKKLAEEGHNPAIWLQYVEDLKVKVSFSDDFTKYNKLCIAYDRAYKAIPFDKNKENGAYARLLLNYADLKSQYNIDGAEAIFDHALCVVRKFAVVHIASAELQLKQGNESKAKKIIKKAHLYKAEPCDLLETALHNVDNGHAVLLNEEQRERGFNTVISCSNHENETADNSHKNHLMEINKDDYNTAPLIIEPIEQSVFNSTSNTTMKHYRSTPECRSKSLSHNPFSANKWRRPANKSIGPPMRVKLQLPSFDTPVDVEETTDENTMNSFKQLHSFHKNDNETFGAHSSGYISSTTHDLTTDTSNIHDTTASRNYKINTQEEMGPPSSHSTEELKTDNISLISVENKRHCSERVLSDFKTPTNDFINPYNVSQPGSNYVSCETTGSQLVNKESQSVNKESQSLNSESPSVNNESQSVNAENQSMDKDDQLMNKESQSVNQEIHLMNKELIPDNIPCVSISDSKSVTACVASVEIVKNEIKSQDTFVAPKPVPVEKELYVNVNEEPKQSLKPMAETPCVNNKVVVPPLQTCQIVTPMKTGSEIKVVNGIPYTVLKLAGKGGSAKVYQVFDADKNVRALKCVDLEGANDIIIQGYKNEINLLKRLQYCDAVIKMYDYDFDPVNNKLNVIMEYGETDLASNLLNRKKGGKALGETTIKFYWQEMLRAVNALHQEGIIHSDLKPANFIFVAANLKLIDFGIADAVQQDKTSVLKETQVGTLSYMSPEAILESCDSPARFKVNVKSDVWSLGCILYNMVYSKTPFQHIRNQLAKIQAITNDKHVIEFPDIPDKNLLNVLKSCLVRDPKLRPTTDELLQHPYIAVKSNDESPVPNKPKQKNLQKILDQISEFSPRSIQTFQGMIQQMGSGKNDTLQDSDTPPSSNHHGNNPSNKPPSAHSNKPGRPPLQCIYVAK
ncbi:dual specificity protein kinase TTK isoform X2 [Patella vulgata]|uniref:dual specificity protein kinase TTK isoform X2 n=1 Tax=Patella vulgata TaxID=6465 RepID=UPI0024A95291|nr:dual specificity protein kinase TTK isoform X2 [Patella vulgata]